MIPEVWRQLRLRNVPPGAPSGDLWHIDEVFIRGQRGQPRAHLADRLRGGAGYALAAEDRLAE
jgi:hypothetical protein